MTARQPLEAMREVAKQVLSLDQPEADAPADASALDALADEAHYRMIAEAAYYRAEQRGFEPGHELEDWLVAEQEIKRLAEAAV